MADAEEAGEILGEEDQTEVSDTVKQMIEHAPVIIPQVETNHVDTAEKSLPLNEPTEAAQLIEEQELASGEQVPKEAGQELTTEQPAPRDREQEWAPGEVEQEFTSEEQEQSSAEQQELIPQYMRLEDDQEELLEGGGPGISLPAPSYVETTEDRSQITTDKFMELLASEQYDLKKTPSEPLESEMKPLPEWMTSATATVKIMLVPDIQMITMAFNIYQTAGNLKQYFATPLKIPESVLRFLFQGRMIEDSETLLSIGVRPHETVQIEMLSLDPENYPIRPIKLQQEYNMPDVITVRVEADANTFQDVAVEIERPTYRKPFLGGFKHRETGVEFHNAGSQTIPKKRPGKGIEIFCRETQTIVEKNKQQQTRNTTSTQMTKIGVYVSNMTDKLIKPGKYLTADEYHKHRLDAVVIIQTYLRRWHAINAVQKLRQEKRLRLEWEAQEEVRRKKEKEEKLRREHERRLNPKTKEDFELLYNALELWRQEEIAHINSTLSGAERKAALCSLLEQETQLIASIGRHELNADEENQQKAILYFLNKCAKPKKWKAFDGKITEMDTQYTLRARELLEIYRSISMKDLLQDERLDVLLTLRHTVKEHDCKLTQEIVELIDREVDLMMRGVKRCNLEGLRKRICTLFLQYIKTPTFNPEVARVLKVPPDPLKLYKNINFCHGCENCLPSTEFSIPANSLTVGRCRRCCKLDNEARQREAFLKYKFMLKNLRQSEADYQDDTKIAFLVQEEEGNRECIEVKIKGQRCNTNIMVGIHHRLPRQEEQQQDLQYMVENIWGCQSALSACNDLYDLVMVRWDKHYEWSPWNTILLTEDEAKAHLKLSSLEEAYEMVFIHRIKHKHVLAKNYFSQIPEMASFLHRGDRQTNTKELLITKPVPSSSEA